MALCVVDRVEDGECPEAAAVLADAPALVLEVAGLARDLQRPFRFPGGAVLGREEPREMLADDLRLEVALGPLSARVPARDDAVRGQHVDGVVGDRPDEELEAILVARRLRLGIAHFYPRSIPRTAWHHPRSAEDMRSRFPPWE